MVSVETETDRTDGVTLVRAVVTNPHGTAQRVRLRSRIDGPTWPPRPGGVIAPNWDGDIWEGTVRAGRQRGVGFATPGSPVDPAMEVVAVERASDDEFESVDQVLTQLEEWSPPSTVMGNSADGPSH